MLRLLRADAHTQHRHALGLVSRVEGEGAMEVTIAGGDVADVTLRICEPPPFLEAFLRGRRFSEVPDITARICGICPATSWWRVRSAVATAAAELQAGRGQR